MFPWWLCMILLIECLIPETFWTSLGNLLETLVMGRKDNFKQISTFWMPCALFCILYMSKLLKWIRVELQQLPRFTYDNWQQMLRERTQKVQHMQHWSADLDLLNSNTVIFLWTLQHSGPCFRLFDKLQLTKCSMRSVKHENREAKQSSSTENIKILKLSTLETGGETWQPPFQPKIFQDVRNATSQGKLNKIKVLERKWN